MKVNKFWKKALCLVLTFTLALGAAPVSATTHDHETTAEVVKEINAALSEAYQEATAIAEEKILALWQIFQKTSVRW